jgi:hypothetical protein
MMGSPIAGASSEWTMTEEILRLKIARPLISLRKDCRHDAAETDSILIGY